MLRLITLSVGVVVVACAAGSQPGEAKTATNTQPAANSDAPAGADSIDGKRAEFVDACVARANNRDFCECSFGQFREVFAGVNLEDELEADDPRLADLQRRVVAQCANTIPEETVRKNFIEGCIADDARKEGYCMCAWPALREHLSPVELMQGSQEDARFMAAKKAMVVKCEGKFPAAVAEEDFMAGCMRSKAGQEERCRCLWEKVSTSFTVEEIAAGTVDVSSAEGLETCNQP